MVKLLLESGANPNMEDEEGETSMTGRTNMINDLM